MQLLFVVELDFTLSSTVKRVCKRVSSCRGIIDKTLISSSLVPGGATLVVRVLSGWRVLELFLSSFCTGVRGARCVGMWLSKVFCFFESSGSTSVIWDCDLWKGHKDYV